MYNTEIMKKLQKKSDNQFEETICETNMRHAFKKEFKTVNEVIFGWDKLNAIAFLILVCLFCIWCVTFFITYKPNEEQHESHDHHMGMHE